MTTTPHIHVISRWAQQLTTYPRVLLTLGLLGLVTMGAIGLHFRPAPPAQAFRPARHPALVYREQVKEAFGMQDPLIIAVINFGRQGMFTPHTLALVQWLTDQLVELGHASHPPILDPDHVVSLVTADVLLPAAGGSVRAPLFAESPHTQAWVDRVRMAVRDAPHVSRSLVTPDGSATLIVTDLLEPTRAAALYDALVALLAAAPVTEETLQLKLPGQPLVTTTLDPLRHALTRQAHAIAAGLIRPSAHHHDRLL
jgi:hypothetical protein